MDEEVHVNGVNEVRHHCPTPDLLSSTLNYFTDAVKGNSLHGQWNSDQVTITQEVCVDLTKSAAWGASYYNGQCALVEMLLKSIDLIIIALEEQENAERALNIIRPYEQFQRWSSINCLVEECMQGEEEIRSYIMHQFEFRGLQMKVFLQAAWEMLQVTIDECSSFSQMKIVEKFLRDEMRGRSKIVSFFMGCKANLHRNDDEVEDDDKCGHCAKILTNVYRRVAIQIDHELKETQKEKLLQKKINSRAHMTPIGVNGAIVNNYIHRSLVSSYEDSNDFQDDYDDDEAYQDAWMKLSDKEKADARVAQCYPLQLQNINNGETVEDKIDRIRTAQSLGKIELMYMKDKDSYIRSTATHKLLRHPKPPLRRNSRCRPQVVTEACHSSHLSTYKVDENKSKKNMSSSTNSKTGFDATSDPNYIFSIDTYSHIMRNPESIHVRSVRDCQRRLRRMKAERERSFILRITEDDTVPDCLFLASDATCRLSNFIDHYYYNEYVLTAGYELSTFIDAAIKVTEAWRAAVKARDNAKLECIYIIMKRLERTHHIDRVTINTPQLVKRIFEYPHDGDWELDICDLSRACIDPIGEVVGRSSISDVCFKERDEMQQHLFHLERKSCMNQFLYAFEKIKWGYEDDEQQFREYIEIVSGESGKRLTIKEELHAFWRFPDQWIISGLMCDVEVSDEVDAVRRDKYTHRPKGIVHLNRNPYVWFAVIGICWLEEARRNEMILLEEALFSLSSQWYLRFYFPLWAVAKVTMEREVQYIELSEMHFRTIIFREEERLTGKSDAGQQKGWILLYKENFLTGFIQSILNLYQEENFSREKLNMEFGYCSPEVSEKDSFGGEPIDRIALKDQEANERKVLNLMAFGLPWVPMTKLDLNCSQEKNEIISEYNVKESLQSSAKMCIPPPSFLSLTTKEIALSVLTTLHECTKTADTVSRENGYITAKGQEEQVCHQLGLEPLDMTDLYNIFIS